MPEQLEKIERIEKPAEAGPERPAPRKKEIAKPSAKNAALPVTETPPPQEPLQEEDEDLLMIKNILSEDVAGIYKELSDVDRRRFRAMGEETALKIKLILERAKVKAREIFELIVNWLKMLPHINDYFLEQEAKIKTDKMLTLKKQGQKIEK